MKSVTVPRCSASTQLSKTPRNFAFRPQVPEISIFRSFQCPTSTLSHSPRHFCRGHRGVCHGRQWRSFNYNFKCLIRCSPVESNLLDNPCPRLAVLCGGGGAHAHSQVHYGHGAQAGWSVLTQGHSTEILLLVLSHVTQTDVFQYLILLSNTKTQLSCLKYNCF